MTRNDSITDIMQRHGGIWCPSCRNSFRDTQGKLFSEASGNSVPCGQHWQLSQGTRVLSGSQVENSCRTLCSGQLFRGRPTICLPLGCLLPSPSFPFAYFPVLSEGVSVSSASDWFAVIRAPGNSFTRLTQLPFNPGRNTAVEMPLAGRIPLPGKKESQFLWRQTTF